MPPWPIARFDRVRAEPPPDEAGVDGKHRRQIEAEEIVAFQPVEIGYVGTDAFRPPRIAEFQLSEPDLARRRLEIEYFIELGADFPPGLLQRSLHVDARSTSVRATPLESLQQLRVARLFDRARLDPLHGQGGRSETHRL